MSQASFQKLLDNAHVELAVKMESIASLDGEVEKQRLVINSLEGRISDLVHENTEHQSIIRKLRADKESADRMYLNLKNIIAKQEEGIQDSADILLQKTTELASLRKECDAVKTVNARLLGDIKAERSKSVPSDPTSAAAPNTVSAASTSSKRKKVKATLAANDDPVHPSPAESSATQALRSELAALRMERDVDIKALTEQLELMRCPSDVRAGDQEGLIVDALKEEINDLTYRLGASNTEADNLREQYVCAVASNTEQLKQIALLTEEVKKVQGLRDAENKSHQVALEALRSALENDMRTRSEEYLRIVANLREDTTIRESECLDNTTLLKIDEGGHDSGTTELIRSMHTEATNLPAAFAVDGLSDPALKTMNLDELRAAYNALSGEYSRLVVELKACETEKKELTDSFREFKGTVADRERAACVEYTMTISDLQKRLSEADGLLLLEQSNVRAMEKALEGGKKQIRELSEEMTVGDRMRQKAEARADTEIKKADLSERRRKESVVELEEALKKLAARSTEVNSLLDELHTIKMSDQTKELEAIISERDSIITTQKEAVHHLHDQIRQRDDAITRMGTHISTLEEERVTLHNRLQSLKTQFESDQNSLKEQLESERKLAQDAAKSASEALLRMGEMRDDNSQYTDELYALSEAFQLRGNLIKDLERRYDVALSDLSFLKMDTTQRANRIQQLEEEVPVLKKLNEEANLQIQGLSSRIQGLEGDIDRTKQRLDEKTIKLQETALALGEAEDTLQAKKADLDSLTASHRDLQAKYVQLKSSNATTGQDLQEALNTMEELSATAAEEIESREKKIASLRGELRVESKASKEISHDYEKLSTAYETVVHQYSDLVEERQQLFNAFAEARNEIDLIKAQIRE